MNENSIATRVIEKAIKVHRAMGPGLLESVYEQILCYELRKEGMKVVAQQGIGVVYEEIEMPIGFRADIIVEDKVIIEIKAVEYLIPVHYKQLLTYLRLTDKRLGILLNFNEELMKEGIHRVVNRL